MEEIRSSYRIEEEPQQRNEVDRRELELAADDEMPFHIPRD